MTDSSPPSPPPAVSARYAIALIVVAEFLGTTLWFSSNAAAFELQALLALSAREWDVLGFLLARAGKVVAKEQIASASNGWEQGVSDNAIEVCVSRLRAKIEPAGLQLRTVRGLGYLLEEMPAAPAAKA